MNDLEQDKLTQLHANTMNIKALIDQIKYIQEEHQRSIERIHRQESIIANMTVEMQQLKQTVMVIRAMSMGTGSTSH
jgi:hypothetical protein